MEVHDHIGTSAPNLQAYFTISSKHILFNAYTWAKIPSLLVSIKFRSLALTHFLSFFFDIKYIILLLIYSNNGWNSKGWRSYDSRSWCRYGTVGLWSRITWCTERRFIGKVELFASLLCLFPHTCFSNKSIYVTVCGIHYICSLINMCSMSPY